MLRQLQPLLKVNYDGHYAQYFAGIHSSNPYDSTKGRNYYHPHCRERRVKCRGRTHRGEEKVRAWATGWETPLAPVLPWGRTGAKGDNRQCGWGSTATGKTVSLFFCIIVLAILGPWPSHTNFGILSMSSNSIGLLKGNALNQLGKNWHLCYTVFQFMNMICLSIHLSLLRIPFISILQFLA